MFEKIKGMIVGLGNDYRRDDAVGLYIVRHLKNRLPAGIKAVVGVADGTDLIELWKDKKFCIVIDAVLSDSRPGTIHRYDGRTQDIPENIFSAYSTHAFNITKTIKMAEMLRQLPDKLIIYGIEGADFAAGQEMTEAVKAAADKIIEIIKSEIDALRT